MQIFSFTNFSISLFFSPCFGSWFSLELHWRFWSYNHPFLITIINTRLLVLISLSNWLEFFLRSFGSENIWLIFLKDSLLWVCWKIVVKCLSFRVFPICGWSIICSSISSSSVLIVMQLSSKHIWIVSVLMSYFVFIRLLLYNFLVWDKRIEVWDWKNWRLEIIVIDRVRV